MSQPERRAKIAALLSSPVEGERSAARAALDRMSPEIRAERPSKGSKEERQAIEEWCNKIAFCVARLGSRSLSNSEVKLIRMLDKGRGDPWDFKIARVFLPIYEKLKQLEAQ